jgi:hypothetical protein
LSFKAGAEQPAAGKSTKQRKTKNMKLIKLASMAVMATLALGVYSAKATLFAGHTTNYSTLTFALTLKQQALYDTNKNGDGKTYVYTIETVKLNNKDLLAFLTNAFSTTFPAGAQLEYDWKSNQVVVADSTGTNIYFYCGSGVKISTNYEAYLRLELNEEEVYSGKYVDATPGSYAFTGYSDGYFELYRWDRSNADVYTELEGSGQNTDKYSEKWTSATDKWSDTEALDLAGGYYLNDDMIFFTGKITAKGKGNGSLMY